MEQIPYRATSSHTAPKNRPRKPVAGRRHLPKRCFGSGCARPVATPFGAVATLSSRTRGDGTSSNAPKGKPRMRTLSRNPWL